MSATVLHGRAYVNGGFRCVLAKVGPKWAQVCHLADGNILKVSRISASEILRNPPGPLAKYPTPESIARAFLRKRKVRDMSKRARALCQEILA